MKIIDIRATPIAVPLAAPLRHANGCHWGRFVRTIVEVETDDGLIGLGEMGGGGESAVAAFEGLEPYLLGRDPARIEEMRFLIANPTASLYNNRTQLLAALEFACLDILGQRWGAPVSEILGGRLRDRDRKSTRLNSSHMSISCAVFCLKKKKKDCTAARIPHLMQMFGT